MIHLWNGDTDGNGATAGVIVFDFKKAFDLADYHIRVRKRRSYNFHQQTVRWIVDFLTDRMQRAKIGRDFYSEWVSVLAGVTQDIKTGPWLFMMMIIDLNIPENEMRKYVDDTTICEIVAKNQSSSIQSAVDVFGKNASNDKFQLNCTAQVTMNAYQDKVNVIYFERKEPKVSTIILLYLFSLGCE